jgi:hypothetical protein
VIGSGGGGLRKVVHRSQGREELHSMGEGPGRMLNALVLMNLRLEWILSEHW